MTELETPDRTAEVSALFAERKKQMVGFARKQLTALGVPQSAADPEDLVQNAIASVLARNNPIGRLRPYVYRVIKNEVWQATQRYYRTGQGYGSRNLDLQLEDAGPLDDPCAATDLRLDLDVALSALPQQQRTAVLWNKVLGLTQSETARLMGITPGTVATHCSRAIVALKVTISAVAVALACFLAWLGTGRLVVTPAAGGWSAETTWWTIARLLMWVAAIPLASGAYIVTWRIWREARMKLRRPRPDTGGGSEFYNLGAGGDGPPQ
ncbi:RNA polymerase sigma factor [Streptomyces olivochromogenes]|uniref:RNA polymerase sigma factor n=1 Tax=Streptomyces olivochromogenes TaxID=1963 RepID=UPI001F19E7B3|nr:sigma-70 family RNA polymerase sigma factor [Streptomyces olivochromogenes]MCF3132430.1 sigma-70 family RNA polymerase sigma factor [Streptomyces olivochromogenes]